MKMAKLLAFLIALFISTGAYAKCDNCGTITDIKTVEIGPDGKCMLSKISMSPEQIENQLVRIHQRNPKLVVYIRADKSVAFDHVAAILNRLERNGIDQISIRTTPPARAR